MSEKTNNETLEQRANGLPCKRPMADMSIMDYYQLKALLRDFGRAIQGLENELRSHAAASGQLAQQDRKDLEGQIKAIERQVQELTEWRHRAVLFLKGGAAAPVAPANEPTNLLAGAPMTVNFQATINAPASEPLMKLAEWLRDGEDHARPIGQYVRWADALHQHVQACEADREQIKGLQDANARLAMACEADKKRIAELEALEADCKQVARYLDQCQVPTTAGEGSKEYTLSLYGRVLDHVQVQVMHAEERGKRPSPLTPEERKALEEAIQRFDAYQTTFLGLRLVPILRKLLASTVPADPGVVKRLTKYANWLCNHQSEHPYPTDKEKVADLRAILALVRPSPEAVEAIKGLVEAIDSFDRHRSGEGPWPLSGDKAWQIAHAGVKALPHLKLLVGVQNEK